jgi:hypothetical protein
VISAGFLPCLDRSRELLLQARIFADQRGIALVGLRADSDEQTGEFVIAHDLDAE